MPLPPDGADNNLQEILIREGADRIRTGLDWLSGRESGKVTLISHSRGGADLLFYAADGNDDRIESLVVIGVNGVFGNIPEAMNTLQSLSVIRAPVLDVYGANDLQGVRDTAVSRKKAARSISRGYRQTEVAGADHFFEGMDAELLELVVDWLENHHASKE
jgi:pimeloyl-ACP methyl ester carboxylesterase